MQRARIQGAAAGAVLVAAALGLAACSSSTTNGGGSSGSLSGTLNGSGSSFQLIFQQTAIQNFKSIQPGMTVNYGGGGSDKGRTDLASNVVQFAGSDSPIPAAETANFKGKTVLYFPVVIGPITVSYNLSGVSSLKLDAPVIADIFQAKITKWNDPAITALNPGVKLPSTPIVIARRSDSSGTTANFSQFLVDAAPNWKLGTSSTISWPANSQGGSGNGGVAQIVHSTPGAIGYVDYSDAKAAADNATINPDLTFSAIWASGAQSYPITYQSWDLVYQKQSSTNTTKMLKAYIGYLLGDGQKLLPGLNYAPLPTSLDQKAKAQLSKIGT